MEFTRFSSKTVEAAIEEAALYFHVPASELETEVLEEGNAGFFGIGSKPAVIQARKKFSLTGTAEDFLAEVFRNMNLEVELETVYNDEEKTMDIDLKGEDMGILIGKRGQTLDSLQYLTSLVVNKYSEDYIRVKLDIENYRERRKDTLETLARNIAYKVRRTRKPVSLEPMNPYERRIIHSALQNDKYVLTSSEGEEPFRYVVVSLKKERKEFNRDYSNSRSGYYREGGSRRNFGSSYGNRSGSGYRNYDRSDRQSRYGSRYPRTDRMNQDGERTSSADSEE